MRVVFSTNEDLAKFIRMILNDGFYKGKKILSKATIDQFFIPKVVQPKSTFGQLYQRSLVGSYRVLDIHVAI